MKYTKIIIPGIGLIAVLILAAVKAPAEIITYSILIESCIFIIADPYRIIHFWLSMPARWIVVTMVVVDTVVIRTHITVQYVAIPIVLSLAAFVAIIRFNRDWQARKAYKESPTVSKAMSINEESSAWRSWIYHGAAETEEMAYRVGIYTRKVPFNPKDVQTWNEEQKRIENREPINNLKQSITVERMKDFLGMVYRLGYLRSVSYKAELLEITEQLEKAKETIQMQKEQIGNLVLDKKEAQVIISDLEEALAQAQAEADSIRESWGNDTSQELEYKKERDNAVLNWQSAIEYAEELEKQIDALKTEKQNLQSRVNQLKKTQITQSVQVVGKVSGNQQVHKHVRRMTETDIQKIKEMRKNGCTISEIAEKTGFSESSVKRAFNKETG